MTWHTSETRQLLEELVGLGVRLEVAGDRLLCHAPAGRIPPDVALRIRHHKPKLLARLREAAGVDALPALVREADPPAAEFPLASAQTWMWLHEELSGSNGFYAMSVALRIVGSLDACALARAWEAVCERHAALRTVCVPRPGAVPLQRIRAEGEALRHCGPLAPGEGDIAPARAEELLLARRNPIRAGTGGSLATAALYAQSSKDHFLLIDVHHLVADGWSVSLMLRDLLDAYRAIEAGAAPRLPCPKASHAHFVHWQADYLRSAAFGVDVAFWKASLEGAPESFEPWRGGPGDIARDGETRVVLEPALVREAGDWAVANGGTLHSTLLAMWCATLQFWTQQDEFVIGTVLAGRPHPAFESTVGCFINTLPIRANVDPGATFSALHAQLRDRLLQCYEHQHCPIDRIAQALNPTRSTASNPLFNIAFLLQNHPKLEPLRDGLRVEEVRLPHPVGGLDLRLVAGQVNDEFTLSLEYRGRVLDGAGADRLLRIAAQVLAGAVRSAREPLSYLRDALAWTALPRRRRVVVGATFTIEPLLRSFDYWRDELNLPYALRIVRYAQVLEALLDPASPMRSGSDHNCLFVRLEDWIGHAHQLRAKADEFVAACADYERHCATPLTVWLCPPTTTPGSPLAATVAEVASELARRLGEVSGVELRPFTSYAGCYDFSQVADAYLDEVAHVPYRSHIYTALGTLLARELAAWQRPPLKAVVVDADGTLWQGVCGEVGAGGVVVDAAARAVQSLLRDLRARGVLLCLCSKNAVEDVRAALGASGNVLSWSDFSASRVNWYRKSDNIRAMAVDLRIAQESIVFVDDNPAECAEVEAACPEVRCVALPSDRGEVAAFLQGIWDFDVVGSSPQAQLRLGTYRTNEARERLREGCADPGTYLRELRLEVTVRPLAAPDYLRVVELTGRTTQFNFSGRRKSVGELSAFAGAAGAVCRVVEVRDRFGDYGLTGLLLGRVVEDHCELETFLLSCRVLGKRVEHEAMDAFIATLASMGVRIASLEFIRTERNLPARMFADDYFSQAAPLNATAHTYRTLIREQMT